MNENHGDLTNVWSVQPSERNRLANCVPPVPTSFSCPGPVQYIRRLREHFGLSFVIYLSSVYAKQHRRSEAGASRGALCRYLLVKGVSFGVMAKIALPLFKALQIDAGR
jgi:hypothetical protein